MDIDMQNADPLVSVIMPAYNAERFIDEAISSVLAQSISDLELIVIDDGSKDQTIEIVTQISQKDPRVTLTVNEENMGVGRTRNRGLDICRGKYVALLDSDDYWMPQLLEKMIARAQQTGADITYCSYAMVDEQGKKCCNDFIVPEETDFRQSAVRNVISCSTVLFSRQIVDTYRFPTDMYHEDIALWFQMLRDGRKARGIPEVLAAYRQREDSKTSKKFQSACRRWVVYRKHLGLSVAQSMGFMIGYAFYGLKKYKRV